MKLLHLRKEAAFQFNKTPSYQQHKHEIPLNSPEMQTFATCLLVGSKWLRRMMKTLPSTVQFTKFIEAMITWV